MGSEVTMLLPGVRMPGIICFSALAREAGLETRRFAWFPKRPLVARVRQQVVQLSLVVDVVVVGGTLRRMC
jgi:hypothetical protein